MARLIGIRHRRKKTAEGEARPTTAAIFADGAKKPKCFNFKVEDDELDFMLGRFPVKHEAPEAATDVLWYDEKNAPQGIHPHHCKWEEIDADEAATFKPNHVRTVLEDGLPTIYKLVAVPVEFDGLKPGDNVAMALGGSGDYLAGGLYNRGQEIGASVYRIKPMDLKREREAIGKDKDDDHLTLATLLEQKTGLFAKMSAKDLELIEAREAFKLRQDAMKARVGCEQRMLQRLVGKTFLLKGQYPAGLIKDRYEAEKANSETWKALDADQKLYGSDLQKIVRGLRIWKEILEPVSGCGERIAVPLILAIGDIKQYAEPVNYDGAATPDERRMRMFRAINKTLARVKAKCGAHVLFGGKYENYPTEKQFPRRRKGEVASWDPDARQSLFLLCDQFNRQTKKFTQAKARDDVAEMQKYRWGGKLVEQKAKYRQTHPEPVEVERRVNGKTKKVKIYTDGHIHKMALKWTATKFVEWLAREWLKLEKVYG